jgi:hypothetical protein
MRISVQLAALSALVLRVEVLFARVASRECSSAQTLARDTCADMALYKGARCFMIQSNTLCLSD